MKKEIDLIDRVERRLAESWANADVESYDEDYFLDGHVFFINELTKQGYEFKTLESFLFNYSEPNNLLKKCLFGLGLYFLSRMTFTEEEKQKF